MVTVVKANGDTEEFSEKKLLRSIRRSGIPRTLQEEALHHVKDRLHRNITTKEIYSHLTEYLEKSVEPFAKSRYSLKEAIMMLGPTGYPFEDYIGQVLEHRGYQVKTRQVMKGKCITHEIDVIARKNGKTLMVEAKFHNNPGTRTEVHVSMYTKARFDDVKTLYNFDDAMIITNTKATIDAIAFAECVGMKIFSWSYPDEGSLRDIIEAYRLFPITSLTTLTQAQKIKLLQNHIVLCKSILASPYLLDVLRLSKEQEKQVLGEIAYLCEPLDDTKILHPSPQPSNTQL